MTKVLLRRKVLALRKLGKSYGQIKSELRVSKSTLSDWLKAYPLSNEQLQILRENNEEYRIEKYRETMRRKRERKLKKYYKEAKNDLLPFTKRELLIAGIFLYWGEGTKQGNGQLVISNTDPSVIKFSILWMKKALRIPKEKMKILVHLYKDMSIEESLNYWSEELNIPRLQFEKPYIKQSKRSEVDEKGAYGHGTCNLRVSNTFLKEKILMTIEVIRDYSKKEILNP